MAASIKLVLSETSYSIENNTSVVSWKLYYYGNGVSYSGYNKPISVTFSSNTKGSDYEGSSTFEKSTSAQLIASGTKTVNHDDDGSATFKVSASFDCSPTTVGKLTTSESLTLTTIPRKSTLSVANGTLGTAQTLTITEKASKFYHILKATCDSKTEWIIGSSGTPSNVLTKSWTPQIAWATENTTGTSVSIKFELYTYENSAASSHIGTRTYTKTFTIPSSVKPSVSIVVSDPTGLLSTYGKYVQGKSKLKVVATASGSQGSSIKTYKTTANEASYSTATATTGVIKKSGTLTVSTTVKDSRGRTATATKNDIQVHPYSAPKITAMTAERTTDTQLQITFSSVVSTLKNGTTEKNTAAYVLKYKKASETSYTSVTLSSYANNLAVTNGTHTITVEAGSSYDVQLEATDNFGTITKEVSVSSAFRLWSWLSSGLGWAFGKVAEAELENYLDVNLKAKFRKAVEMDSTLTLSDNLTGKYLVGTWLQTTETSDLGAKPPRIAVLDASGWVYYRTPAEILSDIAALPVAGGKMTGSVVFNNNKGIKGLTTGGTETTLAFIDDSNRAWLGSSSLNQTRIRANNQTVQLTVYEGTNITGYFRPVSGTIGLGSDSYRWYRVYAQNAESVSSDERMKNSIEAIRDLPTSFEAGDNALEVLFKGLIPKIYCLNDDKENKIHIGFVAQDVEAALSDIGMSIDDVDFIIHEAEIDEETGEEKESYSLAYQEFIALNTHMIQKAHAKIEEQNEYINKLEARIEKLEKLLATE